MFNAFTNVINRIDELWHFLSQVFPINSLAKRQKVGSIDRTVLHYSWHRDSVEVMISIEPVVDNLQGFLHQIRVSIDTRQRISYLVTNHVNELFLLSSIVLCFLGSCFLLCEFFCRLQPLLLHLFLLRQIRYGSYVSHNFAQLRYLRDELTQNTDFLVSCEYWCSIREREGRKKP